MFRKAVALNIGRGLSPAPIVLAQLDKSEPAASMPAEALTAPRVAGPITVFVARKFVTMDPGWPEATAVAVADGRIVSVGRRLEDLKPWTDTYPFTIDERFKDKVIIRASSRPIPIRSWARSPSAGRR